MTASEDQARTARPMSPILLIGPDAIFQRALAREIESLPAPILRARSLADANQRASNEATTPEIVLLPESTVQPEDFESELAELRVRTGSPRLVPIAFGRAPDEKRRYALRQAGIDLALFGRFGRNALRFQINRALSPYARQTPRGVLRAPKEWRTRTFSLGKVKTARCYSLSSQGVYLVTPRPWVVGSEISFELPIGHERLVVAGNILYTNLGDHDTRRGLPGGMGVAFRSLSKHIRHTIQKDVSTVHQSLAV